MGLQTGDTVCPNIWELHHNQEQWKEPEKFIPERFDPESDYSKTPSGEKRDPGSYMPFLTGKRSCFGKTFAEIAPRVVCCMMVDAFDLQLEDPKFETIIPFYSVNLLPQPEVNFIIRNRQ